MELENIINETRYNIKIEVDSHLFKVNHFILGSIVPFGDYWYWSGVQHNLGVIEDKDKIKTLKNDFIKSSSRIVYRYHKQLLNKAQETVKVNYEDFISFFGNDLVIFDDGLSMAAALQKKDKQKYDALPKEKLAEVMKKHGLNNPFPNMKFPDSVLNCKNGVAVFYYNAEGIEIMLSYHNLISGLKKQGEDLTEDEEDAIRGFIESTSISPDFVFRVLQDYSVKSLQKAFFLNTDNDDLVFLLHRYKGHFYRNRYPDVSLVLD